MQKTAVGTPDPLAAPEWLVERVSELQRLMSSSDRTVADGVWAELIRRGIAQPNVVPGRVLGPLGWKPPVVTSVSGSNTVADVQVVQESA
jgi:hypothetical protein